ncbi:MAG: hypothetical protein ACFFDT_13345 [Candidatus Hodarchaeota archaeon]
MEETRLPAVTIARMINWKKPESIHLPPAFIEKLVQESDEKWAVVILHSETGIIRVIPTTSSKAVKLTILGTLPHNGAQCFLELLKVTLSRIKIQSLYNFCRYCKLHTNTRFRCMYEGYLSFTGLIISQDQFKAELIKITGIKRVHIYPIPIPHSR